MAIAPPNEHLNELIRALGFDPSLVFDFRLIATVDDTINIEVCRHATEEDIKHLKGFFEKYELVLKKKEDG